MSYTNTYENNQFERVFTQSDAEYAQYILGNINDYAVEELFRPNESPRMLVYLARENNLASDDDLEILDWYVNTQI